MIAEGLWSQPITFMHTSTHMLMYLHSRDHSQNQEEETHHLIYPLPSRKLLYIFFLFVDKLTFYPQLLQTTN